MSCKVVIISIMSAMLLLTGCDVAEAMTEVTETGETTESEETNETNETSEDTEASEETETTEISEMSETAESEETTEAQTEKFDPDIVKITLQNYQAEIYGSEKLVIVDFYADWCGPCQNIAPILEEIASENSGVRIAKVNVDYEVTLASMFGIEYLPTLVMVNDGQIVQELVGFMSKEELMMIIESVS